MFSWEDNRNSSQTTYRLFGKLTQKFGSDESNSDESSSTIKNAFFTIQADYTNNRYTYADENHGDNLFHYGYVGKIQNLQSSYFQDGIAVDSATGQIYTGQILSGWADTLFTFEPGSINPSLVNYTSAYYDVFSQYGINSYQSGTMSNFGIDASNDGIIRTAADLQGQGF